MLDTLNSIILMIGDPLLGWLLGLPRDVALFIVAIGTALILTVVRLFTTNQNLLGRCKKDKARLKQLMREAKKTGDKDAVARYRTTTGQIGMKTMKAEGKPLLASIVPIAILACWCWARIAHVPPTPDKPVGVNVYFTVKEIGNLVHIEPQDGLQADSGWIQEVVADVDPKGNTVNGIARWEILAAESDEPYHLEIRYNGKTYEKELIVDGRKYSAPLKNYTNSDGSDDDSVVCSELALKEYKLFTIVPGIPWLALQPWIVGYLIIVMPFSFLLKPVLRIH